MIRDRISEIRDGQTYSIRRFRLVVALLTIVTLPFVIGTSYLIYQYLRYSVLVERRLKGERWMIPSRVFSRPMSLHRGQRLTMTQLVNALNGLKYEEKGDGPANPGEFVVDERTVAFFPRFDPRNPEPTGEPLAATFGGGRWTPPAKKGKTVEQPVHVQEIRGRSSKTLFDSVDLEPELITYLFDESREKRRRIRYADISDNVKYAVLAIEDRRFFSHPGLDPLRLAGALIRNLRTESDVPQGGSTITQQLVKLYFLREADERGYRVAPRTYKRKIQEAMLAFVLERRATKEEILELYLNEIYLGQIGSFSINGVGQAARMYFHKDVANLTLPEAALLAGMIRSPNPYNPYRHPERALDRRNRVLCAMNEAGFIDAATSQAALAQPLHVERPRVDSAEAPYFVDLVREQLAQRYGGQDLTTQNLSIFTSLDPFLQTVAQDAMRRGLQGVDKMIRRKVATPVQGCLIALEPRTGAVVALVGGRSYGSSQYNRVTQARRQPGSTFKPFVYLAAFEATFEDLALPPITPATVVDDSPTVFFYEDKEYTPQNYQNEYHGQVTLRRALALSLNVATVKVAEMVGYDKVANLWSKKMGMSAEMRAYPAVALGSFEATPFEIAVAYNVLANGGLKVDPVTVMRVTDEKGRMLEQHNPRPPTQVVRKESAFLVTHMLKTVIDAGTAAEARRRGFAADAAGKTGTTNDMRDAWFAGYTPDLLCVVWIGFDDNTPLNLSGARAALPIWIDFMKTALAGKKTGRFQVPSSNVVFVEIDKYNGYLATPMCPKVISEVFIAGTEPLELCPEHRY
ncbi:MAG: PBP1A family penicillin-binding protein [Vicinamibacteria bacterium]|nr:PBP1A family penicillin-binding protein [Vicinamibacteria bacterium]